MMIKNNDHAIGYEFISSTVTNDRVIVWLNGSTPVYGRGHVENGSLSFRHCGKQFIVSKVADRDYIVKAA